MKLKKFLAPLLAVPVVAGAMPVANVSAVSPRIYVDITYENNERVRADIMFENIPDAACGGFHVNIGDGWNFKTKYDPSGDKIYGSDKDCTSKGTVTVQERENGEKGVFLYFTSSKDYNLNGRFYSLYLEKNENFNSKNADVNVVFQATPYAEDSIADKTGNLFIKADTYYAPVMLEAQEYIIGDANNDGRVNAIDATWINMALEENNTQSLIVDEIKNNYTNYFPEANCAAAPDATLNDVIDYTDAEAIVQYYADMSTIGHSNTRIGQREFYEIFGNK